MERKYEVYNTVDSTLNVKKIGTHNGVFHCDEVLACYLLLQLPEYSDAIIIRSRDPDTLKMCDIVVDVGGVYSHEERKYDHHQRSFNYTMKNIKNKKAYEIKLSSAGLIYAHYGEQVLEQLIEKNDLCQKGMTKLFDKIYENFVMEVDAIDNGVSHCEKPAYNINTNISSRVANLNPMWNKPDMIENDQFKQAIKLVGSEFKSCVEYFVSVWFPARQIVEEALNTRATKWPEVEIIRLNATCPWISHLLDLEEEWQITPLIKYAIFEDTNGTWRVRAIPEGGQSGSFELRIPLPKAWCGLRDQELSDVTGIPDCIFVHANGFIGGNKTFEGAHQMAVAALLMEKANRFK